MAEDVVTSLRIDRELWKKAKRLALDRDMTMRELIESLLRRELEKYGIDVRTSTETQKQKRSEAAKKAWETRKKKLKEKAKQKELIENK